MELSIIIPVFKVKEYIGHCIKTIISQDFNDFEIIIIDDCTPDDSISIAKNLLSSTEIKVKYLKHTVNRGLSAARNTGIEAAEGKWIFFMDSDDALHGTDALSRLFHHTQVPGVEMICGCNVNVKGENHYISKRYSQYDIYFGKDKILKEFTLGSIPIPVMNKLLLKEIILNNNLYFEEGMINEDELWSLQIIFHLNKIVMTGEPTYEYTIREGSIMHDIPYKRNLNAVKAYEKTVEFALSNNILENHIFALSFNRGAFTRLNQLFKDHLSFSERLSLYKKIRRLQRKLPSIQGIRNFLFRSHLLFPSFIGFLYLTIIIKIYKLR